MAREAFQIQPCESVDVLRDEINEKLGEGTIKLAADRENMSVIETGIFPLDYALNGGIQEGQFNLFAGWEGGGKTTQALRCLANMYKKYEHDPSVHALYVDAENALDTVWADQLRVPTDRFSVAQPIISEQTFDVVTAFIQQPTVKMLIIDSLPALISNKSISESAMDGQMPEQAKIVARGINSINGIMIARRLEGNPLTVILISRLAKHIGVVYGDPNYVTGGLASKYSTSVQVEFSKKKEEKEKDDAGTDIIENNIHGFKVLKLRGPLHVKSGEFDMVRNHESDLELGAIDDYMAVIGYSKKHGFLTGGGSSQKIDGIDQTFARMTDIRKFLIENDQEYRDLKARLIITRRMQYKLPALPPDQYLYGWHTDPVTGES